MSNNPFIDLDADEAVTIERYRFAFPNGNLATAERKDRGHWRLEIHRPMPGPGSRDLEEYSGLSFVQAAKILAELRDEPAGVEQPSTAYTVPADA